MSARFGDFNVLFSSCSHGNLYHIKFSHSEIGKQLYVTLPKSRLNTPQLLPEIMIFNR